MKFSNEEYQSLIKMQEIDRKRIANELHDTSLQTLAHLTHQIELASLYIDKDCERARTELQDVNNTLRTVIDEIRDTIFDLRPMSFDDLGLEEALERLVAKTDRNSEITYRTDIGKIGLSDDFTKLVIYRIIQECIKNCEKHSKAETVSLVIYQDDELHIIVEDDGVGMDVKNIPGIEANHFGYSIIADRIETIDGKMSIDSSPGSGTKLSFDIKVN